MNNICPICKNINLNSSINHCINCDINYYFEPMTNRYFLTSVELNNKQILIYNATHWHFYKITFIYYYPAKNQFEIAYYKNTIFDNFSFINFKLSHISIDNLNKSIRNHFIL